ncbi:uncharacterized protein [Procambarus clarkii]|uniref:uncharacterized protein n=1 Tax=Procambarus clarkii TaxID=6728 RepID=UPI00374330D8
MAALKMKMSRQCPIVSETEGLTVYEMRPSCVRQDQEKKIQVMSIGPMNKRPIKSVLLLGQTGAGKTRVIDAMINHLFGVKFEDNYRFQLKDQVETSYLTHVESQTEYITAYIVYYQAGMAVSGNYMLIDTPGFSDTREGYDSVLLERLTHFVTSDYGIDELNCVALVAQATQNRIVKDQIKVLEEFTSVLGGNISIITQLLATFASKKSSAVVEVVKRAGVQFVNSYHLDNGSLFESPNVDASDTGLYEHLRYRWNWMQREYTKFFEELQKSLPVNLKQTRDLLLEKELLKGTERKVKSIVVNIAELKKKKKNITENLREISDEKDSFIRTKTQGKATIKKKSVMKGHHAHNCDDCMQTCLDYCEDPSNLGAIASGIAAGAAMAVSGAQLGAEVGTVGGP